MNRDHPAVKVKVDMKKDMPRTGEATSSNPRVSHDEEVARVLQAMKKMADLALEGTSEVNRRLKFLKVFISLSPPQHAGNPDEPLEGVEWLERIKQCFDVSDVPEDLKVGFATYCLIGAAHYWREFVKRIRDVKSVTWAEFEKLFLNMYFPETIRDAKRDEFLGLTQGNMTVTQYESKFLQLSRHAPQSTDEQRVAKFLMGLKPSIGAKVAVLQHDTYLKVRAATLLVERSYDMLAEQESFEGASSAGEKRPRKQYVCHQCGEPGHIRANCPGFQPRSPSYPY